MLFKMIGKQLYISLLMLTLTFKYTFFRVKLKFDGTNNVTKTRDECESLLGNSKKKKKNSTAEPFLKLSKKPLYQFQMSCFNCLLFNTSCNFRKKGYENIIHNVV